MSDKPLNPQQQADQKRLAKALRDNLHKRKAQQRLRQVTETETPPPESADTQGIV